MQEQVSKSVKIAILVVLIIALIIALFKKVSWAEGFLIGAAWSLINFLLIIYILKIALLEKNKSKLTLLLLVKFPVLYLVGFLILVYRLFPVISLLSGAFLVLVLMGVAKLCLKPS